MGGDGGVVATNRRYMRGAGTADHTGDYDRNNNKEGSLIQQKFNAAEAMTTCALTKTPLFISSNSSNNTQKKDDSSIAMIVTDPHGTLYHKEAAVQALLRRKQQQQQQQDHVNHNVICDRNSSHNSKEFLGDHVRRLADLYDVRFHRENNINTCPITGKVLNGNIPAMVLVPGKAGTPNVVSESAFKQLSIDELAEEYGPITKTVRLAPPPTLLEEIKKQVQQQQEKEEHEQRVKKAEKDASKKKKKKKNSNNKKRKQQQQQHQDDNDDDDDDDDDDGNNERENKIKKQSNRD
jgi:hypothetical protein